MRLRIEAALRTIAALPDDDWQPAHWAEFCAAQAVARDEIGRIDRRVAVKAAADAQRASRAPVKKRTPWKPDPPELVEGKRAVRERSGGLCEVKAEVCDHYAVHVHHVSRRRGPGVHSPLHLLDVCLPCHEYVHAHPEESYVRGWLAHAPAVASVINTKDR